MFDQSLPDEFGEISRTISEDVEWIGGGPVARIHVDELAGEALDVATEPRILLTLLPSQAAGRGVRGGLMRPAGALRPRKRLGLERKIDCQEAGILVPGAVRIK